MDFTQPDTADLDIFSKKKSLLRIKYKNTSEYKNTRSILPQNKISIKITGSQAEIFWAAKWWPVHLGQYIA